VASSIKEIIVDRWSALSHKSPMGEKFADRVRAQQGGWTPSSWTGEEHRRRLTAYLILAAYDGNVARHFLSTTDEADRDERREYGDASLVVDQTLAHLLGESQEIVVPGAEDYEAALDQPPADGEEAPTPEQLADNEEAGALADRQEFLRTWADTVHLTLRVTDCERKAVGLGDGVYLLGWDAKKEAVVPTVMDPGFYFPVLPDTLDDYEYPERVHFAWEIPADQYPDNKIRVRRITYQIATLAPTFDEDAYDAATTDEERDAAFTLPEGTSWRMRNGFREVVRDYPWADEPSTQTCTVTDATWVLDDLDDARHPDAFTLEAATVRTEIVDDEVVEYRDYDLGIDFLPVIHVPNTPPGGEHYGQSSLSKVLQILDDVQNADTDAQAASATTGSPIIGISGSATGGTDPLTGRRGSPLEVAPGEVWRLGSDGRMDVLDTSGNLEATRQFADHLLDRLSINSRLPAAVLGRVKPSEVPSGFAMQLSFGPLTAMIRQMRLVRSVKYPLLLKMVQRLYQANGVLPDGPTPRAEIQFGAYLPSDVAGVLDTISKAYPGFMSLETAVTMMLEVGIPIDDVAEEIRRIEQRDYQGANDLADATGDPDAVYDYLGRTRATPDAPPAGPPAPAPIVPPASAGAGAGA
jgi:hypothetical protein